ncbi:hypothetical protein, partial [Endothiovibrio diazotrophicus]
LAGRVDEPARVTLDGRPLALNEEHAFRAQLSLTPGANQFVIAAEDEAGNRSQRALHIHRDVPVPLTHGNGDNDGDAGAHADNPDPPTEEPTDQDPAPGDHSDNGNDDPPATPPA